MDTGMTGMNMNMNMDTQNVQNPQDERSKIEAVSRAIVQLQSRIDSGAVSRETGAKMLEFIARTHDVSPEIVGKIANNAGAVKKATSGLTKTGKEGQSRLGQFFESIGGMGDRISQYSKDHPAAFGVMAALASAPGSNKTKQGVHEVLRNEYTNRRKEQLEREKLGAAENIAKSKQKVKMYKVLKDGSVETIEVPADQQLLYEKMGGYKLGELEQNKPSYGVIENQVTGEQRPYTKGDDIPFGWKIVSSSATNVNITNDMTKKTQGTLEDVVYQSGERLAKLDRISELFDPSFLEWGGKARIAGGDKLIKAGVVVDKDYQQKYSTWKKDVDEYTMLWRKFITGVAGGEKEMSTIEKISINTKYDNSVSFQAKLAELKAFEEAAARRAKDLLSKGFQIDQMSDSDKKRLFAKNPIENYGYQFGKAASMVTEGPPPPSIQSPQSGATNMPRTAEEFEQMMNNEGQMMNNGGMQ